MKVRELREMLESVPDDAMVVVHGGDHSYYEAEAYFDKIVFKKRYQELTEWYEGCEDEDEEFLEEGDKIIKALIIGD